MLPAREWKMDAVLRLMAGVFLCICAGTLLVSIVAHIRLGRFDPKTLALGLPGFALLLVAVWLLQRPWTAENFISRVWPVVLCFYGGILLGYVAQKSAAAPGVSVAQMAISALSFQGAALVLIAWFLREHQLTPGDAFGLDHRTTEALLYGVAAACVFLPIGWLLQWASGEMMRHLPFWPSVPAEQQAVQTLRMASDWQQRAVLGVVTILLAPLAEELLFRGVLYTWIKQLGFRRLALWVTSLLFALVHLNVATFLPLLLFALVLAVLYEKTGNLLASISAHALFNAMNFLTLYLVQRQTG